MAGLPPRCLMSVFLCLLVFLFPSDLLISSAAGCGGNLTAPSGGPVTSPNYPGNYGNNETCDWLITVPAGSTVLLTFDSFSLQNGSDFLSVYDGANVSASQSWRLTGSRTVNPITSTSNVMFLKFTSDESGTAQGFQFSYANNNFSLLCDNGDVIHAPENPSCDGLVNCTDSSDESPTRCHYEEMSSLCGSTKMLSLAESGYITYSINSGYGTTVPPYSGCRVVFQTEPNHVIRVGPWYGLSSGYWWCENWISLCDGDDYSCDSNNNKVNYCGRFQLQTFQSSVNSLTVYLQVYGSPNFKIFYTIGPVMDVDGGRIRLVGGRFPNLGRVEVRPVGSYDWGTVCDDSFDILDATVVCKMLGFDRALQYHDAAHFGQGSGNIYMDELRCSGNETSLFDCVYDGWGNHSCSHSEDVGVTCASTSGSSRIRLSGGYSANQGRVEVRPADSYDWGTVCNDEFDHEDAIVVCRMLGYPGASGVYEWAYFGQGTGPIYMDNLGCTGNETSLFYCAHNGWGNENCGHREDVGIECECRHTLTAASGGPFTSRNYPSNYDNNEWCEWWITVPAGSRIRLTFDSFDIEKGSDFLLIYDIDNVGHCDSLLQNLTGSRSVSPITSLSNEMRLTFTSDHSTTSRGFEFSYTSHITGCGGNLTAPSGGPVTSPNYPGNYGNNDICEWLITVPTGYTILLTFDSFNVNDLDDALTIYDGSSYCHWNQLRRLTGPQTVKPITSTCNSLFLWFTSDSTNTSGGFQFSYTSQTRPTNATGCGGVLKSSSGGVVKSPNYPSNYGNNEVCDWLITVPVGSRIRLTFDSFNVQYYHDFLNIYDGVSACASPLRRLTGSHSINITSTSNVMFLRFTSDETVTAQGFQFSYTIHTCDGNLTAPSGGPVTSPNYPKNYNNNEICEWLITVPEGNTIRLTFDSFDVESSLDVLTIYDGASDCDFVLASISRWGVFYPIISTSNVMFLRFTSDTQNNETARGFQFSYTNHTKTINDIVCGGNLTAPSGGPFTSPNYPGHYGDNETCEWWITVPAGSTIRLTFDSFDVGYDDNLDIYDGPCGCASYRLTRDKSVSHINSTSNMMLLRFTPDVSWRAHQGFQFSYTSDTNHATIPSASGCGGNLTAPSGGPVAFYSWNSEHVICDWLITVPAGSTIRLTFDGFEVDYQDGFLNIYDGAKTCASIIRRLTGRRNVSPITSTSNVMLLRFTHRFQRYGLSSTSRWFQFSYTSQTTPTNVTFCGGNMTAPAGGPFTSTNYPGNYGNDETCDWLITVPTGSRIRLTFDSFEVEDGYDFLNIYDGANDRASLLRSFTGSESISPITSTSNVMFLRFTSDHILTYQGFQFSYTSHTVDYCQPDPCVNGTCSSDPDNFTCTCDDGYGGETCQTPVVVVSADLTLAGEVFTDDLKDMSHPRFQMLARAIEAETSLAFAAVLSFRQATVTRFRMGSVIATVDMEFQDTDQAPGSDEVVMVGILQQHISDNGGRLGNLTVSQVDAVLSPVYCEEEAVETEAGLVSFPRADGDSFSYSAERCNSSAEHEKPLATRFCGITTGRTAVWDPPVLLTCETDLRNLSQTVVTNETALSVAAEVQVITIQAETLSSDDVASISTILQEIVNVSATEQIGDSLLTTVDNLINVNTTVLQQSQQERRGPTRVVQALEAFADTVALTTDKYTAVRPGVALQAADVSPEELDKGQGFAFFLSGQNSNNLKEGRVRRFTTKDGTGFLRTADIAIYIPPNISSMVQINNTSEVRLSYTLYNSSSLFVQTSQGAAGPSQDAVGTRVIGGRIAGRRVKNLPEPVIITFAPLQNFLPEEGVRCVFWDFEAEAGQGAWSTEGCESTGWENGLFTCACNHLTNFAAIFDVFGAGFGVHERPLEVITIVGCAVSIVCLVLTLLSFILTRNYKRRASTGHARNQRLVLINLCVALLAILVIFLAGINQTASPIGCTVVAALLHYFLLAALVWMAVEAVNIYLAVVVVFDHHVSENFVIRAAAVAWGFPLVATVLTVGPSSLYQYRMKNNCWLAHTPLIYAFLLPAGLILLFNLLVFVIVMCKLVRDEKELKQLRGAKVQEADRYWIIRQIRRAFSIMALFGLTWLFGFFVINDARAVFAYLFCIFNTLQGLFIFIFHCVMREDMKKWWKKLRDKMAVPCSYSGGKKRGLYDVSGRRTSFSSTSVQTSQTTLVRLSSFSYNSKPDGEPM